MRFFPRRLVTGLTFLLFFHAVQLGAVPAQAEVIERFRATLKVNTDSSLDVTEEIVYDFEGVMRHGIYRDIPVVYDRNGGRYTIYLKTESVTDAKGRAWKWTASKNGRNVRIRIGDPDSKVTGVQTYRIRYHVRRALNVFKGAPEIYWNATGDEWGVPMKQAFLFLVPPTGTEAGKIRAASYVGPPGSTQPGRMQLVDWGILYFTENLPPRQGLTIVAGLPAGSLVLPGFWQNLLWILADWWPAFLYPLLAFGTMFFLWFTRGRDVEGNLPAQVEWSPPKDLTPAEVGTLLDERCDLADIVSTLIDLAARGYLRIEEVETQSFLFFTNRDYIFHQLPREPQPGEPALKAHETAFLRGLFGSVKPGGQGRSVTMSSLKERFYVHLPAMRAAIYGSLTRAHFFAGNPETTRNTYIGAAVVLFVLGIVACVGLGSLWNDVSHGLGLIGAGIIVFLFNAAMPAKTASGSAKLRECIGFRRFVQLAEKDRIEKLIQDDPTIFGRLLPYAIVMGVGDAWADKFAGLLKEPPNWYTPAGYYHGAVFHPHLFVNDLGKGMNSMGQTFSSAPKSQGGSGGSGFSGGGSGGGFGGGGGGSW